MKPKSLLILAVAVVALGAFIWFFERHQPSTDQVEATADRVLPDLERESVRAVVVERAGESLRAVRVGDGAWRLEAPVAWPADTMTVQGVLDAVLGLDARRILAEGEVAPADYGLDDAALAVTLETDAGDPIRLAVGDEVALGSDRAVTLGDGRIIFTSARLVDQLEKPTDDWRSREVLGLSLSKLAALTVVDAAGDRVEAVSLDDVWRLVQPVEDRANEEHLNRAVGDLAAARIAAFADDPTPEEASLLAAPAYRLSLNPEDGSPAVSLEISEALDGRRLCRRDGTVTFWIDEQVVTPLTLAPVLWREPRVWPFSSWDVEAVDITVGDGTVALRQDNGLWTVDGATADAQVVRTYLQDLADLEAAAFDLSDFGEPVRGTVQLVLRGFGDDEPEEVVLTFFEGVTDGSPTAVTVSGRPGRMALVAGSAEAALVGAEHFEVAAETAVDGVVDVESGT
jgi:hypothetical protein